MKVLREDKICPNCRAPKLKSWDELTDEQKMLAERLPLSAQYSPAQRKKHRFCVQCFYEQTDNNRQTA
jgi:hypothetical protein